MHTPMYTYTYVLIHTNSCTHTYIHTYTHTHKYRHAHAHMYMYVCIHTNFTHSIRWDDTGSKSINALSQKYHDTVMCHCLKGLAALAF